MKLIAILLITTLILVFVLLVLQVRKRKRERFSSGNIFRHPTFVMSPEMVSAFRLSVLQRVGTPEQKKSISDLLEFAEKDLSLPSKAVEEIRVIYNPAPHDLAKATPEFRARIERQRAEMKILTDAGKVGGHDHFTGDSIRCYRYTLAFLLTRDEKYANKIIQILTDWAKICKRFGTKHENGPLEAGWGLCNFAAAAEVVFTFFQRPNEKAQFINFVETLLMPNLRHFDDPTTGKVREKANKGNWLSTITQARLQYAIFKEDKKEFDWAVDNARTLMGNSFVGTNGQMIETLRDIVHAQFHMAGLTGLCEILWHHGIDLYSTNNNILRSAYEFHARILLGDIPEELKGQKLHWVGYNNANWEIAMNHYVDRLGGTMPKSEELLKRHRPTNYGKHWGLDTLTHYKNELWSQVPKQVAIKGVISKDTTKPTAIPKQLATRSVRPVLSKDPTPIPQPAKSNVIMKLQCSLY
jgi:hypothetical protein